MVYGRQHTIYGIVMNNFKDGLTQIISLILSLN
jgi:hypothetical protein